MISANPEVSLLVSFDGGDAVVGESHLCGDGLQALLLHVVAEESVVGAYPQASVVFLHHATRGSVVQAVLAEGGRPALFLDVETAESECRGTVDTLAVG